MTPLVSAPFPPPDVVTDQLDDVLRQEGGPPAPEVSAAIARADYDAAAGMAG